MRQALRLPARERKAIRATRIQLKQLIGIIGNLLLLEAERVGTVLQLVVEVGLHPVEHRHKVVANHLDAVLGEIPNRLLVVLDIAVTRRQADLDVIVNVDRLNHLERQAGPLNLTYQLADALLGPNLAHRDVH